MLCYHRSLRFDCCRDLSIEFNSTSMGGITHGRTCRKG